MPNDNLTAIYAIIDGSGSMNGLRDTVISSFNEFIDTHKKLNTNVVMSLTQFNSDYEGQLNFKEIRHFTNVKDMPKLTRESYDPTGGTPLLAALSKAVDEFGEDLAAMPEHERPARVLFLIMTDGQENTSDRLKFTKASVRAKTRHQEEKYNWRFIYLGANQDAFAEAGGLGIQQYSTRNFAATPKGVQGVMRAATYASASYSGNLNVGAAMPTNSISDSDIKSLVDQINNKPIEK